MELRPAGPFSLAASGRFLEGFAPASYGGPAVTGHLHLAFIVDGTDSPVGVCCRQKRDPQGSVEVESFGEARPEAVRAQVRRILSLDVDGSGFSKVGKLDHVIGALQARYPGLRPVLFFSPYEAAAWAIIGARISIRQAARVKATMAERLGRKVDVHGERLHAFPDPTRLSQLDTFPGLFARKPEWLRGVAQAALDGQLDADRLRSLPTDEALAELRSIPGIGPFSAELILLRGAGEPDAVPTAEPRLRRAVGRAYGRPEPSDEELIAIADGWRPYRTWAALLLRMALEDETGEIAGRRSA
ncbi:DNA-3-methyladenine glycosylase [soil metagenome]